MLRTNIYRDAIEAELMRCGHPDCVLAVLAGHVHFASMVHTKQRTLITNATVCEQPYRVRVIGDGDGQLTVRNIAL